MTYFNQLKLMMILTISLPVLFEQPNSRGGLIVFCRVLEVWYSAFPPRAAQKPAEEKTKNSFPQEILYSYPAEIKARFSALTWLFGLSYLSGSSSEQAGNILGCSHLPLSCSLSLPHEQGVICLQHKHVIRVQSGGSGQHLGQWDTKEEINGVNGSL